MASVFSSDTSSDTSSGSLTGRYTVLEYLAEGGMGAVYLGKKLGAAGFEKRVVLKQLLPEFTSKPEFIELFLQEARLSATLDHANIIHTIDLVTAGDEMFIVMEYLDGADLRSILSKANHRGQPIDPASAIYIARSILSALSYAHAKRDSNGRELRLIHRDISPSNILISGAGEVKLTDFGIAKAANHDSMFYRVKGKVGYMSPEQARSQDMDARSDLYSLAVCLFEMITGQRLLVSTGIAMSADELYGFRVPAISALAPGLPRELDEIMIRALSVSVEERYQTASEFRETLLRCAHRHKLMMSAPELAKRLLEACGPPLSWRMKTSELPSLSTTRDVVSAPENLAQREGMERIEATDEADDLALFSDREKTSLTLLGDLRGMELTSVGSLTPPPVEGQEPLVSVDSATALSPWGASISSRVAPQGHSVSGYTGEILVRGQAYDSQEAVQDDEGPACEPVEVGKQNFSERTWVRLASLALLSLAIAAAIGFTGPQILTPGPSKSEAGH